MLISDSTARERVINALREEGLAVRIVGTKDFSVRGLEGTPVAALVYDLAPWTEATIKFLHRLRGFPRPVSDLPVLLYAPQRPEVPQLLVEAGRFSMVWGEMQFDRGDEVRRLRRTVRRLLEISPAAIVFRLMMFYLPDLPAEVVQFCRLACGALAAGRAGALTVSRLAWDLGVERRTLERHWRRLQLPAPKELLDWVLVVFAAHLAERHGRREIYDAADLMGMDVKRVRRSRFRLKTLWKADSVEVILMHLGRRFSKIRVPRQPPSREVRVDVPLYEAAGL